MKVLFIGGTGNISSSCSSEALSHGIDLWHLNRGNARWRAPTGVNTLVGDIRDQKSVANAIANLRFDVVVDWIAFTPDHVRVDLSLFRDRTDQFIFISSASVYQKPPSSYVITESTPAHNPFWKYSQEKIACEELLRREYAESGFPVTIVRPSHTYSDGWFPSTFGSRDFTVPQRIIDGRPIVVHGDGQSLWTITHADDFAKGFAGLLGNPAVVGETFHITSDEALSWDQIHVAIGRALGETPKIVHVTSETIAAIDKNVGAGLLGDKRYSVVFDNSKIKRFVPGYTATIPFHEGMRRSARWIEEHPEMKSIDHDSDALIDRILARIGG